MICHQIHMRIWSWLLNCIICMLFLPCKLFLCSWFSMSSISHPLWVSAYAIILMLPRFYAYFWNLVVGFHLGLCRDFYLVSFFWIILRNHDVCDDIPWDVVVMMFYFINPLRVFYELWKLIMHVLDYRRCSTLNLVFIDCFNIKYCIWGFRVLQVSMCQYSIKFNSANHLGFISS